jgi:DNA mismatch repair protein MutS2
MQILPKGSVTLDTSNTGATLYMEPKPALKLNNRASTLEDVEKAEEDKVLLDLCSLLVAAMTDVDTALASVTAIDLACARARHAQCAPEQR